jgi:hypothetical protein
MNQLTLPKSLGALPSVFANQPMTNDDLSAGIQGGFGIISVRGKTWRVKFQGEERVMMRDDGDGPRSSIEVVVIKSASVISKVFYEKGYDGESSAPPDCWSTNGQTPDPAASKKQSNTCAGCKQNAFGAKISDAGKALKACGDSKRLAVVPLLDIPNELFGGPMLLRVPAASLKEILGYAQKLSQAGYPYYAVATRISFDVEAEFPRLIFGAMRVLNEDEARMVAELRGDPRVNRILNEAVEVVHHEPDASPEKTLFEQPPAAKKMASSLSSLVNTSTAAAAEKVDPDTGEVTAAQEAVAAEEKARRTRRTKAEMEAARAAEAAAVAAATPQVAPAPVEDDEETTLLKQLAALKAAKAAKAAPPPPPAPVAVADDDEEFNAKLNALLKG